MGDRNSKVIDFFQYNFGYTINIDSQINNVIKALMKNTIYIHLENFEKNLYQMSKRKFRKTQIFLSLEILILFLKK